MFIVFEGIDGSGKTTHVKLLAEYLKNLGRSVLCTREPGGTDFAEKLRQILLCYPDQLDPYTQLLLILAARRNHYYKVILPAVKTGVTVICDRFIPSTIVYQGSGFGLDVEFIKQMHKNFGCFIEPNLTIVLDVNYLKSKKPGDDRFEKMDKKFFEKLLNGYRDLAQKSKNTFLLKRGRNTTEQMHQQIVKIVNLQ